MLEESDSESDEDEEEDEDDGDLIEARICTGDDSTRSDVHLSQDGWRGDGVGFSGFFLRTMSRNTCSALVRQSHTPDVFEKDVTERRSMFYAFVRVGVVCVVQAGQRTG